VKTYAQKVEVSLSGEHTPESHSRSSGILSVKQRSAVKRAVRSSPQLVGSQVHAGLENFSPGKRVPFDSRSQKAVNRLVRRERKEIMAERVPGIDLDTTEGAMNRLAESISLEKLLARHNDPADDFHMDEHQVVQVGYQFKHGVTFMCMTTPHLLNNLARADNCKFEVQGHFDGAFGWCDRDFALLGFGVNSLGAHYNPVSISIVNSESKTALDWAYDATCAGLYTLYNKAKLCDKETCGFCTQIREQIEDKTGTFKARLASEDATNMFFPLDKPSSDNPNHFFAWAKEKFGEDTKVLQCGHHLSCKCCPCVLLFTCAFPPSLCLRAKYQPPGQTPPSRYLNSVNCDIKIS
jgi:hypothetical protein